MRSARKRELVDKLRGEWKVSVRRACATLQIDRSLYVYKWRRGDQAALKHRIKDICETRVRYGYRRVHVLLQRDGWATNIKRVYRLYRLEGLQMRLKPPRRRVMAKLRSDRSTATGANQIWAMDWMHDELFDGRRIWVLTIVDTWSRLCPVMRVCRSATAMEVISALEEARARAGLPHTIRVDQGCQFTSKEFDLWAYTNSVTIDFSRPGRPTDNAYAESFNAIVRLECLGQPWFMALDDAREKVEAWRAEYNEVRPHSAIGDRTPMSLIQQPRSFTEAPKLPETRI